jgi:hypothetical protein
MFQDPLTGKRRSIRHDPATLPARIPIAHILNFCMPQHREQLRRVSSHWCLSEKASRQQYYHPLVIGKCSVTEKVFNANIDYRKRFIGLANIAPPNRTLQKPARVKKEFDVQASNVALQQFNEQYSLLVIGQPWKIDQDEHTVIYGETLFKQRATISFLTHDPSHVHIPEPGFYKGEVRMNVKLEQSLILPKSNNNQIMVTFWIVDKKTDAIGKWGEYDSLLTSWDSFNIDGTSEYHPLNDWTGDPMEVGPAWTGGHCSDGCCHDNDTISSFPWFDAMHAHKYYDNYRDVDVEMSVNEAKYKLVTPPAMEAIIDEELGPEEMVQIMNDAYEQWVEDNPDTLTEFEMSFATFASDSYNAPIEFPFKIDDLCKSVDTVSWI